MGNAFDETAQPAASRRDAHVRYRWGLVVLAIGFTLLMLGVLDATPSHEVPVRSFAPPSNFLDVLRNGTHIGSSSGVPGCPNSVVLASPVYAVTWAGGNRDVTIRVGDQIDVASDSSAFYLAGSNALCFVQSAGGYGGQVDTFQATHPGSQIVFENRLSKIEVIKVVVLAPVPTRGWPVALMVVGGALVVVAVVMLWVVYSRRFRLR